MKVSNFDKDYARRRLSRLNDENHFVQAGVTQLRACVCVYSVSISVANGHGH